MGVVPSTTQLAMGLHPPILPAALSFAVLLQVRSEQLPAVWNPVVYVGPNRSPVTGRWVEIQTSGPARDDEFFEFSDLVLSGELYDWTAFKGSLDVRGLGRSVYGAADEMPSEPQVSAAVDLVEGLIDGLDPWIEGPPTVLGTTHSLDATGSIWVWSMTFQGVSGQAIDRCQFVQVLDFAYPQQPSFSFEAPPAQTFPPVYSASVNERLVVREGSSFASVRSSARYPMPLAWQEKPGGPT